MKEAWQESVPVNMSGIKMTNRIDNITENADTKSQNIEKENNYGKNNYFTEF